MVSRKLRTRKRRPKPHNFRRHAVRLIVLFGMTLVVASCLSSYYAAQQKLGYFSARDDAGSTATRAGSTHSSIITNRTSASLLTSSQKEKSPMAFLSPKLHQLIQDWQQQTAKTDEETDNPLQQTAAEELASIVSDPSYIQHRPNSGIIFVKTHKAGSSTVAAVLHALGTSHRLRVPVIAAKGKTWLHSKTFQGDHKAIRKLRMVVYDDNSDDEVLYASSTNKKKTYDIWCNHVRFDLILHEIVPTTKIPQVVSIVRDPATRVRSGCQYYGCCPASTQEQFDSFVLSKAGESKLSNPHWDLQCELDQAAKEIVGSGGWTMNAATPSANSSTSFDEEFAALLNHVQQGNVLLMVMERMTESMLVLQHDYKLHPLDITFLSKKVNKDKSKEGSQPAERNHTAVVQDLMRHRYNPLDTRLHQTANRVLDHRLLDMFGKDSQQEATEQAVKQLETLNDIVAHVCRYTIPGLLNEGNPTNTTITAKDKWKILAEWCEEKELDNTDWNNKHLQRIKKRTQKQGGGANKGR